MYRVRIFLLYVLIGIVSISSGDSYALNESMVKVVKQVVPEGYIPLGMQVGAFVIDPALRVDQKYDDNIYRRENNRVTDNITIVSSSVDIRTNWNLHELRVGAKATAGRYHENKQENYEDYSYYISGRYDVDYGTFLNFSARSEYRHEDRGSLEDVNGDTPIEYRADSYNLGFTRELGILKLYVKAGMIDYSYDNSTQNSVVVDHGDRDYKTDFYSSLLVYGLTDNFDVYTQGKYNRQRYDRRSADYRNSHGNEYRVGMRANVTGKLKLDFFTGYSVQRYAQQGGVGEAIIYGGDLLWNVNGMTSVKLGAVHSLEAASLANATGVMRTRGDVDVQHALKDNVFLGLSAWYQDDSYDEYVQTADKDNKAYGGRVGVEYLLNRSVRFGGDYDFIRREYDTVGEGYKNHEMSFFLKVAY